MRVAVTGVTGRIGANVAADLIRRGHEVRGLLCRNDPAAGRVSGLGLDLVEGDLGRIDDVRVALDTCDAVIHLGAAFQAGGPFTPEQYFDINVKGTFHVLEVCREYQHRVKHVVVTSTDATVDKYPPGGFDAPLREDSLPQDVTAWYGYTKTLCEHLADRYLRADRLPVTVLRFAYVWGPGEVLTFPQFRIPYFRGQLAVKSSGEAAAARAALDRAESEGATLVVARDPAGRSWMKHALEIRDILHAYSRLLCHPGALGRTLQLASAEPFAWETVVPHLGRRTGETWVDLRLPITPSHYWYDLSAARNAFGYAPSLTVEQMIDDALDGVDSGSLIPNYSGT